MSDEAITAEKPADGWEMPEPIFRTTDGRTPQGIHETEPLEAFQSEPGFREAITEETTALPSELDDSVEPGFRDASTIETKGLPTPDTEPVKTTGAKPVKVKPAPEKPKKRGCAKTFLFTVSMIALGVAAVIVALVYFLFYYKPAETGNF